jgi:hypothetical protein
MVEPESSRFPNSSNEAVSVRCARRALSMSVKNGLQILEVTLPVRFRCYRALTLPA